MHKIVSWVLASFLFAGAASAADDTCRIETRTVDDWFEEPLVPVTQATFGLLISAVAVGWGVGVATIHGEASKASTTVGAPAAKSVALEVHETGFWIGVMATGVSAVVGPALLGISFLKRECE